MNFGKRLARIRKEQKMTQIVLSEISGCHINMVRRYEANKVQPSLDVIRRLSVALSTSADSLVFSEDERCQKGGVILGLKPTFSPLTTTTS